MIGITGGTTREQIVRAPLASRRGEGEKLIKELITAKSAFCITDRTFCILSARFTGRMELSVWE